MTLGILSKMAKDTKEKILNEGIKMWLENYMSVNANAIARRLGVTHGTVLYHFPLGVREAVAAHAVKIGNSKIIRHLIVTDHPAVDNLSPSERSKYFTDT